ncbi:MAG: cytochrome d ubiquinol oxidase subunit II [Candidatus Moduliflexus flocculans]|nr:cytochrome d ubiquinol oxidase subunit II [Candidatus Moduliflexus flocculans]
MGAAGAFGSRRAGKLLGEPRLPEAPALRRPPPLSRQRARLDRGRGRPPALGRLQGPEDRGRRFAGRPRREHPLLDRPFHAHLRPHRRRGPPDHPQDGPQRAGRRSVGGRERSGLMEAGTFLQNAWFLLIGVLFAGYSVLDGFDLGDRRPASLPGRDRGREAVPHSGPSGRSGTATRSGCWPAAAPFSPPSRRPTRRSSAASTWP